MSSSESFFYDAFISYSRKDVRFATLLARSIESYRPPKDVAVERRRLRVFRDEDDLVGSEYYEAIDSRVRTSKKLILVCSPDARASHYVNDEVRRFVAQRGREHVIPVLLRGTPDGAGGPSPDAEPAFPAALTEALAAPLALSFVDFGSKTRSITSGRFESSWYQLLASIYRLNTRTFAQREQKRRKYARCRLGAAMVLLALLGVAALTVGGRLWRDRQVQQNLAASRRLADRAEQLVDSPGSPIELPLLLAVEAHNISDTAEAKAVLMRLLHTTMRPMHRCFETRSLDAAAVVAHPHEHLQVANWHVALRRSPAVTSSKCDCVPPIALGADKRWLACTGEDGAIVVCDLRGNGVRRILDGHRQPITALSFSRDGRRLVSGSADRSVIVWDVASGEPALQPLQGHESPVSVVRFSGDGALVSASFSEAIVWRFSEEGAVVRSRLPLRNTSAVAVSGDGTRLATAQPYGDMSLWELFSPEPAELKLTTRHSEVFAIAFSDDPDTLVSVGCSEAYSTRCDDVTIRFWDARDGRAFSEPLRDEYRSVDRAIFDETGRWLTLFSDDEEVFEASVWHLPLGTLMETACDVVSSNLHCDDWAEYVDEAPYRLTCPENPSGCERR